jgi:hypothetical protein
MSVTIEQIDWPDSTGDISEIEFMRNVTFPDGAKVVVDNRQFEHCRFMNNNLVYAGGPFAFAECTFEGQTLLSLTGAAKRTQSLQRALAGPVRKGIPLG